MPFVRPRILLYFTVFSPAGGANGVTAWMLQALREDYDITLLTWVPFDLDAINRVFGTSLRQSDFRVRMVSPVVRKLLALDPDSGSILRHLYLMRVAKRMRRNFDLVVSADNEADFGPPALQYVHAPFLAHVYPRVRPSCDLPFGPKAAAILRGEIRPWMLLGDFSFDRMKRNRTLVNSDWTGRWTTGVYGIPTETVHPPAPGDFPDTPWERREDGFVMLGRLSGDKRPDWVLQILQRVRANFPHIRLHMIGVPTHHNPDYAKFRSTLSKWSGESSWFTVHENLSREALATLVARQRYGIHAIEDEHFGMAVAEMMSAGCLPFVHNSGGPPDIVGQDPRLLYGSIDEAVNRISHVLAHPAEQLDIRSRLAARRNAFTPAIFMSAIRREVARALANRETHARQS